MTVPAADTADSGTARICYVYAVGRSGPELEEAAAGLTGVDGTAVRTVDGSGLAALVSAVPADRFGEEGMRAQMEDLERLEAVARSHHAVVAAAYEHTTVLPMRLATVYLEEARVAGMLRERRAEFSALLSRLEGHVEWGVKVYADPAAAASAPPAGAAGAPTSPGRAYLQQRRAHRRRHQEAYRAAGEVASRVAELAERLAAARVTHRPQQGELAGGAGENIANEAYLVAAGRGREFHETVGGLARDVPGVRVEVTGPWAPYSFATPPQQPRPAAAGDGADRAGGAVSTEVASVGDGGADGDGDGR